MYGVAWSAKDWFFYGDIVYAGLLERVAQDQRRVFELVGQKKLVK